MILELLKYLTTPCPRAYRKIGYLSELLGIEARYARCRTAWQSHIDATRALILEAADLCPQRRVALIVGSGLCLDVPLADLAARFERVILVDILHVPAMRRLARRHPNVELAAVDVTCLVEEVYAAKLKRVARLPRKEVDLFFDRAVDYVASVNILSQLPTMLVDYIIKKNGKFDPEELEAFSQALLRNHLAWLGRFKGVVSLCTDLKRSYLDAAGTLIEEVDSLFGLKLPYAGRTWVWDIAPIPELDPAYSRENLVLGVLDINDSAAAKGLYVIS